MSDGKMIVGRIVLPATGAGPVMPPVTPTGPSGAPLPQDIIKDIAEDIGKSLVAYIEVMYPEAIKATSSTFKLSMRNHVYNDIMEAVRHNDPSLIRKHLEANEKFRKEWVGAYRKMRRKPRNKVRKQLPQPEGDK